MPNVRGKQFPSSVIRLFAPVAEINMPSILRSEPGDRVVGGPSLVRGDEVVVLVGAWIVITILGVGSVFRFRRYSEGGWFWFLITLPVFLGWNWVTLYVLFWTGVTGPHPRFAWLIVEVVCSFPLVFTIAVLTVKLRRPRPN